MRQSARPALVANQWVALAILCAAFFMGVLDSTSVYATLPTIAADLDFSDAGAQWVITAWIVAVGTEL